MGKPYSVVIRGGTVVDGTGAERYEADVAFVGDRIAAIDKNLDAGEREFDARGRLVTPGFVDLHTHYDAQVTWSSRITPSSWNGVTTAMIGNCGVGFAPCLPARRDMLIKLMEGVEDIPEVVLTEGLPWNWESFGSFLDALEKRVYDLDVVTQVPHSAVRVHVMGERGARREPATAADRRAMAALAADGIRAGALGFSTSRTINHRTLAGEKIPTLTAAEEELAEIGEALRDAGQGWMQVISDFDELDTEVGMLRRVAARSGRPMAITVLQRDSKPDAWRDLMHHIADARAGGVDMRGQVIARATGVILGFEISLNPFSGRPSWEGIKHLPLEEKLTRLREPSFRARLIGEPNPRYGLAKRVAGWDRIYPLGDLTCPVFQDHG